MTKELERRELTLVAKTAEANAEAFANDEPSAEAEPAKELTTAPDPGNLGVSMRGYGYPIAPTAETRIDPFFPRDGFAAIYSNSKEDLFHFCIADLCATMTGDLLMGARAIQQPVAIVAFKPYESDFALVQQMFEKSGHLQRLINNRIRLYDDNDQPLPYADCERLCHSIAPGSRVIMFCPVHGPLKPDTISLGRLLKSRGMTVIAAFAASVIDPLDQYDIVFEVEPSVDAVVEMDCHNVGSARDISITRLLRSRKTPISMSLRYFDGRFNAITSLEHKIIETLREGGKIEAKEIEEGFDGEKFSAYAIKRACQQLLRQGRIRSIIMRGRPCWTLTEAQVDAETWGWFVSSNMLNGRYWDRSTMESYPANSFLGA